MTHLTNADEATADRRTAATGEARLPDHRMPADRMLWPMLFPYRTAAPRRPATLARPTADGESRRTHDAQLRAKSP